ncbi:CBS domain-containing protein [Leekyejoonella antrihumi]|uniref:CBS domain-containing protein n=1 Tax=Leekyejoonella antrihumi TaxID=1660198 RepID=A0A563DXB5_9MICO|nr:CBS domain-containing protein [Leekyejoonella antrihumi]TWP34592.1 CBS domain-containing protein [Leekyejoonella antrihumi]
MRARDLAQPFPIVDLDTDALQAAATMGRHDLPGLVVRGADGLPLTVIPASQVLRFVIPAYVQEDPHLARVYDERAADEVMHKLAAATVADVLPKKHPDTDELPVVDGDATGIEVAALMARTRSPIVVVVEDKQIIGAIRIGALLGQMLPSDPPTA